MSTGYNNNGTYVRCSGLSAPIPTGTGAQLDQMISKGILKEGDQCICTDDYEDVLGDTDISAIGDGTLTGAISNLSQNITNINESFKVVSGTTSSTVGGNVQIDYPSGFNQSNCVIISFSVNIVNRWYFYNDTSNLYPIFFADKIVVSSNTATFANLPFRVVLMKIS